MKRNLGLGLLHPKLRLIIVILSTSWFAFIDNIGVALIVFFCSSITLLLGNRVILKKALIYLLILNAIYMILGNWVFSPKIPDTITYEAFIFRMNKLGLENGIIGALKRNSMIILSFAWLSSIYTLFDAYLAISIPNSKNKILIIFLRWLQNIRTDFTHLYYSLQLRGLNYKSINVINKIWQLNFLLKGILNSFFFKIGNMTFNGESHFIYNDNFSQESLDLILEELTISYSEGKNVLFSLTTTINSGDFVLISGDNRSGRSSFLKSISGYIPKIEGSLNNGKVLLSNGLNISDSTIKESSKYLRYITNHPNDSIIGLTPKQELSIQSKDSEYIIKILDQFGITQFKDRGINTLSGGEQTRVVLSSALCSNSKLLLLDSPFCQLDNEGKKSLKEALKLLKEKSDVTIIIVDYEVEHFIDLIDELIILEDGKIKPFVKPNNSSEVFKILAESNLIRSNLKPFSVKVLEKTLIKLTDISLNIRDTEILKNITLSVLKNECISITGENGSGKSSLMNIIANLVTPNSGKIEIDSKKIGFIMQDCSKQVIEDTIEKELILNNSKHNSLLEYFNKILSKNYIDLNSKTNELTSSELRFIEIFANSNDKEIIIFDEPTNGLSPNGVESLHALISKLISNNCTILIVTHDNNFARLCKRHLLMHNGELIVDTTKFEEIEITQKELNYDKCS